MLLGVNIDHIATLRNARGGIEPSVIKGAEIAEENESAFDIILLQGLHSFFDKPMTHTQKNKIVFRISFRHMNLIGVVFIFTFGMIATI